MVEQALSTTKDGKRRRLSRRPATLLTEKRRREDGKGDLTVVLPAGCEVAQGMQAQGLPVAFIASVLGVSHTTMKDCVKRQPELADAMAAGAGELEGELVKLLIEQARGGYAPAAMFLLKSKCGYRETGPPAGGDTAVQVNIQIPAPMPAAEFQAIISGQASGAPVIDQQPVVPRQTEGARKALPRPQGSVDR